MSTDVAVIIAYWKQNPDEHKILFLTFSTISPGGVAQVTSHPPQEQKTQVRIPPGYKGFRENIAMLLCILNMQCLYVKNRNKGIFPKNHIYQDLFKIIR
jgi:hypothetical protein